MSETRPSDIADTDVYITRAFDAPRPLVWRFFLQPEHLAEWFAPAGYSTPVETISIDPRVGGRWELLMVDDVTGEGFPMRGTIVELVEPELLVMRLDAETGRIPINALMLRIQFHDHGDRTRLTLHQGPFTPDRQHATESGWLESFEKLDRQLSA
jgi:uncharacterized protein YndB with AHSA1/START domain